MNTDRIAVDARGGVTHGPWDLPMRSALPAPQTDPRLELTDQALVVASHNAYPIVATQKSRRDNVGLAAGTAIALVLGCATFVSLNSSRHPAAPTATAVAVPSQTRPGLPIAAPMSGKPMAAPPVAAPTAAQPAPEPTAGAALVSAGLQLVNELVRQLQARTVEETESAAARLERRIGQVTDLRSFQSLHL